MDRYDQIVRQLNQYTGNNVWEDVIYRLPDFDGQATEDAVARIAMESGRNPAYVEQEYFVAGGVLVSLRFLDI